MDAIVTAISYTFVYSIESADRDTYICSDYSTNMGTDITAIDRSIGSTIISTYMYTYFAAISYTYVSSN